MEKDFSLVSRRRTVQELRECAEISGRYGLRLSEEDMEDLVRERERALEASGRVEFGGGILPKLILEFCDSPYVEQETWAQTLAELQEAFYYFKSEGQERFSDDELIEFMGKAFNGRAQGSVEYLCGTSLELLCRPEEEDRDTFFGEEEPF